MSIPTVAVTCIAYDQNGNPVSGGVFRARLDRTETYNGFVVPEQVTGIANAQGVAVLRLWPNALGVAGSSYRITAVNPDTKQQYLNTTAVVPNSDCNLHEIIVAAPFPPIDASEQALIAAQGALALVTAQANIATAAASESEGYAIDAQNSANQAESFADNARASFTDFDKRYLGTKGSDPIVDNEGNPLEIGALYYLLERGLRIYDGEIWSAAYISESGTLTTTDIGATVQAYSANLDDFAAKSAPSGEVVGTTDAQTLTAKAISGNTNTITDIANSSLTNSAVTFNGQTVNLGQSGTIKAVNPNSLTAGTGLNGASYDGSAPVTLSIANTAVTPSSYGSASKTLAATVNAQGQITAMAEADIAIANTQVSGLGTMSTQSANNVSITGGSITGITDLAVADGGTGASTAENARINLGLGNVDNTSDANKPISIATQSALDLKANDAEISIVGKTGSYNDLLNKPDLSLLEEVLVFPDLESFPVSGTVGKVYIAEDTGYIYRWTGTAYAQLTDQTAIWGQISGTLANQTDLKSALDAKYDASNPAGYTTNTGTVTSVTATAGTGISISGSPITTSGTLTITNTAPDQVVSITGAGATSVSGTYPSFTISSVNTTYSAGTGLDLTGTTFAIDATVATLTGTQTLTNKTLTSPVVSGGTINNTVIGGTTRAAGSFTTLDANGNVVLGDATSDTISANGRFNTDVVPSTTNARDLGTSSLQWKQVYATTFTEGVFPVMSQTDIGTAPNQIPLNQYLGNLAFMSSNQLVINPAATAVPAGIGDMVFELASNTSLVVKVRGSDGTVRSATLTLA